MDSNNAMSNLGFANTMLHHLLEYKGSGGATMGANGVVGKDKEALASGKSSKYVNDLLGAPNDQFSPQLLSQAQSQSLGSQNEDAQQPKSSQSSSQPSQASKPDTGVLSQKIDELKSMHDKEIMLLKHEMDVHATKKDYESKIADMEAKHQKEIDDIKQLVKGALNG